MTATTLEANSSVQFVCTFRNAHTYLYHPSLTVAAALQKLHNASLNVLNPSLRLSIGSHHGQRQKKCAIYQLCLPDIEYRLAILKPAVQTPRLSFNASIERQRDHWPYVQMRKGFIWE